MENSTQQTKLMASNGCLKRTMNSNRPYILKDWIRCLEDISKEFPGNSTNIDTAIKNLKLQLKELEKK